MMNIVPRILAEASIESIELVTPLTSPVHRGLWDSFDNLLDSSKDTMGQEGSEDADESIRVAWEGSREERKAWMRGWCHAIFAHMNEGESHTRAQEDVDAYM